MTLIGWASTTCVMRPGWQLLHGSGSVGGSLGPKGLGRTPVIALTAHAMTGDEQETLAAGLDKHLTKPLRKPAIFAEIAANCPDEARPPLPQEAEPPAAAEG